METVMDTPLSKTEWQAACAADPEIMRLFDAAMDLRWRGLSGSGTAEQIHTYTLLLHSAQARAAWTWARLAQDELTLWYHEHADNEPQRIRSSVLP